jgi:hypothetical protein
MLLRLEHAHHPSKRARAHGIESVHLLQCSSLKYRHTLKFSPMLFLLRSHLSKQGIPVPLSYIESEAIRRNREEARGGGNGAGTLFGRLLFLFDCCSFRRNRQLLFGLLGRFLVFSFERFLLCVGFEGLSLRAIVWGFQHSVISICGCT